VIEGPVSVGQRELDGSQVATLQVGDARAEVLAHGAHLVGLWLPDRRGRVEDVVVSLRRPDGEIDVAAYRDPVRNPHLGGMAGRYANRIADARFELDGRVWQLVPNEGPNQLHGGPEGLDRRDWALSTQSDDRGAVARLELRSDDGDQGYPGTVDLAVTYRLDRAGELQIHVEAVTDAPTVLSVTNHTYWNLAGTSERSAAGAASVRDHLLTVAASSVVRVDGALIPTGDLDPVEGTAFDLRRPTRLGDTIDRPELATVGGLDHCLVLDGTDPAAELVDPASGRRIRVRTNQPGLQVYTANHGAGPLPRHGAVCLETQQLPDAPNRPTFPSPVLRPGQRYRHEHVVEFGTAD
jgi:aldose 1-epimerase